MTALGAIVAIFAVATFYRFRSLMSVLAVTCSLAGFTASAAINVGGNSVTPFYLAASCLAAYATYQYVGGSWPFDRVTGLSSDWWLLPAFVVWVAIVTVASPVLFRGIPVLDPRGGTDVEVSTPTPLGHTISNVAQMMYLLVSVVFFYILAGVKARVSFLPAFAFGAGTVLSTARYLLDSTGLHWPSGLVDNSLNVRYINFTSEGVSRFRGLFPEPSSFTSFSISALVFFVAYSRIGSSRNRLLCWLLAALSFFNIVQSAAGTALTGGALVIVFVTIANFIQFVRRGGRFTVPGLLFGIATSVVVLLFSSRILRFGEQIVAGKIGSESLYVRTTADLFSLELSAKTLLVGVGLGANRPATFWAMLISCTGIIGTGLFFVLAVRLIKGAWSVRSYRPASWALASYLLCKTAAGPNLAEPILWILLGVCGHAWWFERREQDDVSNTALLLRAA